MEVELCTHPPVSEWIIQAARSKAAGEHPSTALELIGKGTFNKVYAIKEAPNVVVRVSNPIGKNKLEEALQEMHLAKLIGEAGIGPSIRAYGSEPLGNGKSSVWSVQAKFEAGELGDVLENDKNIMHQLPHIARQLRGLICRVAVLGFAATDLKPGNIVLRWRPKEKRYDTRLIDYDLYFFTRLGPAMDIAALDGCGGSAKKAAAAAAAGNAYVMLRLLIGHLKLERHPAFQRLAELLDGKNELSSAVVKALEESELIRKQTKHYLERGSLVNDDPNLELSDCGMTAGGVNFLDKDCPPRGCTGRLEKRHDVRSELSKAWLGNDE